MVAKSCGIKQQLLLLIGVDGGVTGSGPDHLLDIRHIGFQLKFLKFSAFLHRGPIFSSILYLYK